MSFGFLDLRPKIKLLIGIGNSESGYWGFVIPEDKSSGFSDPGDYKSRTAPIFNELIILKDAPHFGVMFNSDKIGIKQFPLGKSLYCRVGYRIKQANSCCF